MHPPHDASPIEAALALHSAGAYDEAERAYHGILATDPAATEAAHYLGVLMHQTGRSLAGIDLIVDALASDPDVPSRYNDLGNILVETGAFSEAATVFEMSLDLDPHDANVWNNLGSVKQRLGLVADAESAYRQALELSPDFVPALENLAALLNENGREIEGAEYWCRGYVLPPHDGKTPRLLATAFYLLGRYDDAAACYRSWLEQEPDNPVARHHLAACSGVAVPPRASARYIATTFDDMAQSFEDKLLGKLNYQGPETIRALLARHLVAAQALDVLDAGCGTGLCAPGLRPYARTLTGVDLSPGMLALAAARNAYHTLVEGEICAFLAAHAECFDVVALADTVVYFGDLDELFAAARHALRADGMLVFTVETDDSPADDGHGYRLAPSGRYVHTAVYVERVLAAAGFALREVRRFLLRQEFGRDVTGLGFVATCGPGT